MGPSRQEVRNPPLCLIFFTPICHVYHLLFVHVSWGGKAATIPSAEGGYTPFKVLNITTIYCMPRKQHTHYVVWHGGVYLEGEIQRLGCDPNLFLLEWIGAN